MGVHSLPTNTPERDRADRTTTWLTITLVITGSVAVLGAVLLWPRGDTPDIGIPPREYVDATIVNAEDDVCDAADMGRPDQLNDCTIYTAALTSGSEAGTDVTVTVPVTMNEIPELEIGDKVVLLDVPTSPPEWRYSFEDYQRSTPMLWLAIVFVVAVVLFGRWMGLRALVGLGLSLFVLVAFIVPALLHEQPAVLVALTGATIVAFVAIYLAHGPGITSSIALAGTLASLAATAVLAVVVAGATQLSGLASEEARVLNVTTDALDLRGLLIAGIVIGALGVLDDVTVSQVATVAALRRANPSLTSRELYGEAIRVGRDHVAAAVNTLVLAYAGAALPLLLFFTQGGIPIERILTGELVAVEIVRMLVGSIGLILSVPITTSLAAVVLARTDPLDDHGHSHSHGLVGHAASGGGISSDRDPQPASRSAVLLDAGPDHAADEGLPPEAPSSEPVKPWF
jgi:uncharacterized membrane protein